MLDRNYQQGRQKRMEELRQFKKQQRQELILVTFIGLAITTFSIITIVNMDKGYMEKCIEQFSYNHCMKGLD